MTEGGTLRLLLSLEYVLQSLRNPLGLTLLHILLLVREASHLDASRPEVHGVNLYFILRILVSCGLILRRRGSLTTGLLGRHTGERDLDFLLLDRIATPVTRVTIDIG